MALTDSFRTRSTLTAGGTTYTFFSLRELGQAFPGGLNRLPVSLRIFLENLLRQEDGRVVRREDIEALVRWDAKATPDKEIAFMPARVLLQDFTGVPCVVDLAVMRDAIVKMGGNPARINPLQPVDLVIDHSVQVDEYGSEAALLLNTRMEYTRNLERYQFLRWGQN